MTTMFRTLRLASCPPLMSRVTLAGLMLTGCNLAQSEAPAAPPASTEQAELLAATTAPPPQEDLAKLPQRLQALKERTLKNLVFVKGGSFMMGDFGELHSPDKLPYGGQPDAMPAHKVTLDSFSMSAYQVTYEDYDVFTDATGQRRISMGKRDDYRRPNVPAGASWQDARNYCQWLGKQLSLPMDLPTEAQWEYAARSGGKMVVYATDNGKIDAGRNVASYEQGKAYIRQNKVRNSWVMSVGLYPPNSIGLYDMVANGNEWVLDWYAADYYERSPELNPTGPMTGTERVMRSRPNEGEGQLDFLAMTFLRQHQMPQKLIERYSDGSAMGLNPHSDDTMRCVVNQTKPVRR